MSFVGALLDSVVGPISDLHLNPILNFFHPPDSIHLHPAFKVTHGEDASREVISKRKPCSKTYRLGENKFKVVLGLGIIHYEENGRMHEVDLTIQDVGGKKAMTKAPYMIEIFTDRVGYHLKQRDGTSFTIELIAIGGAPVNNKLLKSTVKGCQVFWDGLVKDISMKVLLLPERPEIFTRISSPLAPRTFTWKVTQKGQFGFKSFGADKDNDTLEILVEREDMDTNSFLYTETWTGRVSHKDKKTRIKRWFNDPVYPVIIDPTVTINISANNDDGCVAAFNWDPASIIMGISSTQTHAGGFRFQNVGVPAGATITSATLKINVKIGGSVKHCRVFGDKVGNAAAWSNASLPMTITKTTSSTYFLPTLSALNNIGVTNQVASIVGLGSWASSHAMRFGFLSFGAVGHTEVFHVYDHNTSVPKSASLVIVYALAQPRHGDFFIA